MHIQNSVKGKNRETSVTLLGLDTNRFTISEFEALEVMEQAEEHSSRDGTDKAKNLLKSHTKKEGEGEAGDKEAKSVF